MTRIRSGQINGKKLKGKVAIVTGGSRGIGKAIAIELGKAGASVAVAARTEQTGESPLPGTIHDTVKQIIDRGGKACAVRCDVTQEKDVALLLEQVNKQYGPIDILVNNAGVTTPEPFLDLSLRKWELVMAVNLRGTFLCAKAVLPQMVERKSGHVINLSSVLAKRIQFSISYGVSKAAIERFTLGLDREMLKNNVSINALCPDFTATEAVASFMKNVDVSGWQQPEMWGKYTAMVAATENRTLTGRILDEAALRELFGPV